MSYESKSRFSSRRASEFAAIAVACAGLAVTFGANMSAALSRLKQFVYRDTREMMTLEEEIEHAQTLVQELVPILRKNHEVIVREQVEIDELRGDIANSQRDLSQCRAEIMTTRARLPKTPPSQPDASQPDAASALEHRRNLRHLLATYQSIEVAVNAKRQLLLSRETSLHQAKEAQSEALRRKKELDAEVASFEARLGLLKEKTIREPMAVQLASFEESEQMIRYLRKKLSVAERLASPTHDLSNDPIDTALADEAIEAEVDRHFAEPSSGKKPHVSPGPDR